MQATTTHTSWLDKPLFTQWKLNWETITFALILLLAVVSRFYNLGIRVMSHDESLHTYYSWNLYRGVGFEHTPMMHGPLQFHLIALSYFLFGDSDFSARIPAALASIATIAFLWNYRRYLGRLGALIAAGLMLISPYMLYYGRYVRNEAYVALFGLVTLWAILRYLETGKARYLYWLTAATALHFTAKETAFIYTAQAMLFLGWLLMDQLSKRDWHLPNLKTPFFLLLVLALVLGMAAGGYGMYGQGLGTLTASETAPPALPEQEALQPSPVPPSYLTLALLGLAALALAGAVFFLIRGYTWKKLCQDRTFSLLVLLTTIVLPHLAPFPVKWSGGDPLDYSQAGMLRTAAFLIPLALVALGIGLAWNARLWLINSAIFYGIFIVFYTTLFTNGAGFFSGLVGSLGYWLDQQGVRRGSQPWYYYLLVQVPVYEYLPALGSLLAAYFGLRSRRKALPAQTVISAGVPSSTESPPEEDPAPALPLMGFWAVSSLLAYTIAGEKMPWLTVHIAWPFILLCAWALSKLIMSIDWPVVFTRRGLVILALTPVFLFSLFGVLRSLLGNKPPFQGKELLQLRATSTFLTALLTAGISGWGLARLTHNWANGQLARLGTLGAFAILGVLTTRTAIMASYINYDTATEYLVYAHSARGVKDVMAQVEDISRRLTGGLGLEVAYDDDVSWPLTWYLRNYRNQRFYGQNPDHGLRSAPIILVGDNNFSKLEPIVGQAYYRFDYIRMWWPNQDYFGLTWERIKNALWDPAMREALFQIWLNRDYTQYASLTSKDMSLENWSPSDRMRMYIRKDTTAQLWNYGVGPAPEEVIADPYEEKTVEFSASQIIGGPGSEPGQFQSPRGIAIAPDGSLYIADSRNHRIQHISSDGTVLNVWGSFADIATGNAPPGTFNEPWGVGVGPNGSVYVADTWNHRIQKFTSDGQFLTMWGYFGQAETPSSFWGPRDVVVDSEGRVFVSDTGNKRIVVFDSQGNYLLQIGTGGVAPGQFDEPVGLALDGEGGLFVADTWNQRVQLFRQDDTGYYFPQFAWDIAGWYGQSLDNKPYLAVDSEGHVFVTDPEGYRVLEFNEVGEILQVWGSFGATASTFGLASGIAVDENGGVWVSDAGNHRLLYFTPP